MSDMCYAARYPGMPGYGGIIVDMPEHKREAARDIAAMIRRGATVERVSIEAARAGMIEYIAAKRMKKAAA